MTLKEKFKNVDIKLAEDNFTYLLDVEAIKCEKIADDYAIGFTEWKDKFIDEVADWKLDGVFLKNKYTTKELLEIYKKEKGL